MLRVRVMNAPLLMSLAASDAGIAPTAWQQRRGLRPRDAAVLIMLAWLFAIVLFGILERIADPKSFPTIWLGMWWALETVTTVGYGDVVPATPAGKIIGSFLLLGGLAFLTVIIAMITGGFVARYNARRSRKARMPTRSVSMH